LTKLLKYVKVKAPNVGKLCHGDEALQTAKALTTVMAKLRYRCWQPPRPLPGCSGPHSAADTRIKQREESRMPFP